MKYLTILLLLCPLLSFGQNQKDYSPVLAKFVSYYNDKKNDSICTLFETKKPTECFWSKNDAYSEYGRIVNYKYLGVDPIEKVAVYKVQFEKKGTKAISFTLVNKKFGTFRFDTSSDYIERMLAKEQSK